MPKREYVHLSLSERDLITTMAEEKALGRSKSTVSREIKRNSSTEYRLYLSHRAHGRAELRKKQANTHQRLKNERIESYVHRMLKDGW